MERLMTPYELWVYHTRMECDQLNLDLPDKEILMKSHIDGMIPCEVAELYGVAKVQKINPAL